MSGILTPSFALREPNMASATRKNNEGLCCIHECTGRVVDWYCWFGHKVCEAHAKKFSKGDRRIIERSL